MGLQAFPAWGYFILGAFPNFFADKLYLKIKQTDWTSNLLWFYLKNIWWTLNKWFKLVSSIICQCTKLLIFTTGYEFYILTRTLSSVSASCLSAWIRRENLRFSALLSIFIFSASQISSLWWSI